MFAFTQLTSFLGFHFMSNIFVSASATSVRYFVPLRSCSSSRRPAWCGHYTGGQGKPSAHSDSRRQTSCQESYYECVLSVLLRPSISPATFRATPCQRSPGWRTTGRSRPTTTASSSSHRASSPASPLPAWTRRTVASTASMWRTSTAQRAGTSP